MNEDEFLDLQIRRSRGQVLAEAVWRRLCMLGGSDPKDPALMAERTKVVTAVAAALTVMEGGGFEDLERWLEIESHWSDADTNTDSK